MVRECVLSALRKRKVGPVHNDGDGDDRILQQQTGCCQHGDLIFSSGDSAVVNAMTGVCRQCFITTMHSSSIIVFIAYAPIFRYICDPSLYF